jgi:trimeric autotransporter adhesin
MKSIILIFAIFLLLITRSLQAQNITNTLSTSGSFTVKDSSNTFLSLDQATGHLSLNNNIYLPNTTDSTIGVIYKGIDRFLHNYQAPGTVGYNTFMGINSGNFTMSSTNPYEASYNTAVGQSSLTSNITGSQNSAFGYFSLSANTTGSYNSGFGNNSLKSNTAGSYNSAFGNPSLSYNTTGNSNSAFGNQSLPSNTTGDQNSAFGSQSLVYNTTGNSNSAFGSQSLVYNTTGNSNSAFGNQSLDFNTTGFENSAFGAFSLYHNTTGYGNTALGYQSLYSKTIGLYNTAVGQQAGSNITTGGNNIAIGYNAQVPTAAGNNQIRLGNTGITYAGIQVAWTVTSDRRWKENIQPSNLGLGFITKLNPVSYTRKNDENQKTEYGLIAQEIEQVLKEEGIENTGMLTVTDEGYYELRYNDLFAPMIKAIQELKIKNEQLEIKNANLEERLAKYEEMQTVLVKKLEYIESREQFFKVQIVKAENNNQ